MPIWQLALNKARNATTQRLASICCKAYTYGGTVIIIAPTQKGADLLIHLPRKFRAMAPNDEVDGRTLRVRQAVRARWSRVNGA